MGKKIEVHKLFSYQEDRTFIDVRTPAEFTNGHIPEAINIPLFSNEERAIVGTIYKQRSPDEALLQGLEFVGPKMRSFVEQAKRISGNKKLLVHCWRGGRRSESMAWLLGLSGFDVLTISGGYKAYRNYILRAFFERLPHLIVLGGFTGSGKTGVLKALKKRGEQVIDLEGLAHHKGSSFGALGEDGQPTVEQFENNLYEALRSLDYSKRIWIEDESRGVGRVFIPQGLWDQMRAAPILILDVPLEERIQYLVNNYAGFPLEKLKEAFIRIKKRLGGQHLQAAMSALESGDFPTAVAISLQYYDKAYRFGLEKRPKANHFHFSTDKIDNNLIAMRLVEYVNEKQLRNFPAESR